jgi:hypothetical protein
MNMIRCAATKGSIESQAAPQEGSAFAQVAEEVTAEQRFFGDASLGKQPRQEGERVRQQGMTNG